MARLRKRYTDEFRASAVLMLQGAGYPDTVGSLAAVSARVGVAGTTLRRWFTKEQNPPPDKIVAIKKEDLADLILKEAHAILKDMPDARQDASYREMATAFGIMVDKLQLLTGEATGVIKNEIVIKHDDADSHLTEPLPAPARHRLPSGPLPYRGDGPPDGQDDFGYLSSDADGTRIL